MHSFCATSMQNFVPAVFILLTILTVHSQKLGVFNNDYALKMHRTLISEDSNVVTSPLSYLTQLGILQLVSDGNTAREIRRSLGYDSTVSNKEVHTFFSDLNGRLSNQTNNDFKMANVIVLRNNYPATETGKATLRHFYNASVQMYNVYEATKTMMDTNNLIHQATGGIFTQYLASPLDSYNRLAMLNAVHFSGTWQYWFQSVHRDYFYNKGKLSDPSMLNMMSIQGRFPFSKLTVYGTRITAVELPYKNGDLKMLFLLPNTTGLEGLIQIEQQLTSSGLSTILNSMTEKDIKITVPSISLLPGHDLMWSIIFLGVRDAFNNAADFHHLSREKGLFVTKVLHKFNFEMTARGTTAPPSFHKAEDVFVANRPFLFLVRDVRTEMILFMGRIVSLASSE